MTSPNSTPGATGRSPPRLSRWSSRTKKREATRPFGKSKSLNSRPHIERSRVPLGRAPFHRRVVTSRRACSCLWLGVERGHRAGQKRVNLARGLVDEYLGVAADDPVHGLLGDLNGGHLRDIEPRGG